MNERLDLNADVSISDWTKPLERCNPDCEVNTSLPCLMCLIGNMSSDCGRVIQMVEACMMPIGASRAVVRTINLFVERQQALLKIIRKQYPDVWKEIFHDPRFQLMQEPLGLQQAIA